MVTHRDLQGRLVAFAVRDIGFPTPESVLMILHSEEVLQGEVIDVSHGISERFVVVKVAGLDQPIVVPVERIRR